METIISEDGLQQEVATLNGYVDRVRQEIGKVIIGQDKVIELIIAGLLSNGHLLLEGVPGVGKTMMAKLIARTLSVNFSRIQFTPDLMPTDVTGTSVFNQKTADFSFSKGPIFSNIVLIDEINRSPAKTQASLFEVMEERQVTVDGTTYRMEDPFLVLATQNPIEQEGTYRLPEAQLDRFLFRVRLTYPTPEQERDILRRFRDNTATTDVVSTVGEVMSSIELMQCRETAAKVFIKDELLDYIAQLIINTRNHGDIYLGASPRASLWLLRASKVLAAMRGRTFVIPEDIQEVAYPVLNHRIQLTPEREIDGTEPEDVIREILQTIEVPR